MRVISGSARGIKLDTIEGLETRPTTDRVKEAVFSMIQSKIFGSNALDLFCGSGALGIELLSRGAEHVTFVEQNVKLIPVIKNNLARTKLSEQAKLLNKDVYLALACFENCAFDLVIMDPPYLSGHVSRCMEAISKRNLLREMGLLIVEHDISDPEILNPPSYFESLKTKKYGKIGVTVFRRKL